MRDYTMSSKVWPGLGKFVEEIGEVLVNLGKLVVNHGENVYRWDDHLDFTMELEDEIADIWASSINFAKQNGLDTDYMLERAKGKLRKYHDWKESNE